MDIDIIKHVQDVYTRNTRMFVISELISCGILDLLSKEHQIPPASIETLMVQCENNINYVRSYFIHHTDICFIVDHAFRPLQDALKRMQRYWRYCCSLFDTCEETNYLDLIFGQVYDSDGTPTTCSICLDTAHEKEDGWFPLPCKHVFHMDCINTLCEFSDKCPLCRSNL